MTVQSTRRSGCGFNKLIFATVASVLLICGCGGNSSSSSGSGSASASLRVLNATQDVGSVNVVVGGDTIVTGDTYPTCTNEICQTLSGYQMVKSGGVSFALEDTSNPSKNYVPSQFQTLNLTTNTQSTFVLSAPPSENASAPDVGYLFADDNTPAANSVKIRIANVDPRNPTVSAFILPAGTMPTGNPPVSNLAIGSASSYIPMPPGSYTVWFVGNFGVLGPVTSMTWGPSTYSANQNYTVYLMQQIDASRAVILADN
jgi:uncharacterized protein DUF4397